MKVFLNGKIVPEEEGVVSVFDRSFLYGDGLFETIYVRNRSPFRWRQHWARISQGAGFLGIRLPFSETELRGSLGELLLENALDECLLRLTVSRGVGVRGYSPKGADRPLVIMTLHAAAALDSNHRPAWRLHTARHRLYQGDLLSHYKTANKLVQVLARAEAEAAGADEAVLLDDEGRVVEAATGNIFWSEGGTVYTPPVRGILPGVTRSVVFELCDDIGLPLKEEAPLPARLADADEVFVSLSTLGVVAAKSLDGRVLRNSGVALEIQQKYLALLDFETR